MRKVVETTLNLALEYIDHVLLGGPISAKPVGCLGAWVAKW